MLSLFLCACWPSVFLLCKNVYSGLEPNIFLGCLFVCLTLSCVSCLFIFYINLLSVILFANIFSQSIGCLFILLLVSFAVQNLLSLIRSHLLIFGSISYAHRAQIQKKGKGIAWVMPKSVLPVFSSRSLWFQILHLDLYSILSLFLYVVWINVLISLF